METPERLAEIYGRRFADTAVYRNKVWTVLADSFFSRWIQPTDDVLDLGAGYGEFIRNVRCGRKSAMDLNPEAGAYLPEDVEFLHQDCSEPWSVPDRSLDIIFTSNFLEHLPDKTSLIRTLEHAARALKPAGRMICLGPNARILHGGYWDFFDHHIALTDRSLREALELEGFELDLVVPRFLPYTMVGGPRYPLVLVRVYLALPLAWRVLGGQFLLVASRATDEEHTPRAVRNPVAL